MLLFIIIGIIYQMFIFFVVFVYVVESITLIKVYLLQLYNMFLEQLVVASRQRAREFWPNCTAQYSRII